MTSSVTSQIEANDAQVEVISVLGENYSYVIVSGKNVVVIDPGESGPVLSFLDQRGLSLTGILITHYDGDHINGIPEIRKRFNVDTTGPSPSPIKIDHVCSPDQPVRIGGVNLSVIDTPGHAYPHVVFYEASRRWLFSGDVLFGAGCGRVPGGGFTDMWESIRCLMSLPDDTRMFFGHEYTLSNLAFAAFVEPENAEIPKRRERVESLLNKGGYSSPSTLAEEKATNPFLRVSSIAIRRRLNLLEASDESVFTALRKAKNLFRG